MRYHPALPSVLPWFPVRRLESLQGGMAGPVDGGLQDTAAVLQQQIQTVAGQVMKGASAPVGPAPRWPSMSAQAPSAEAAGGVAALNQLEQCGH